jgi:putative hemolysin
MGSACIDRSPDFGTRALAALNVSPEISLEDLNQIPATGPVVVVANHPLGAIDGLLLISLLSRVRSDIKLLGNRFLRHIPGLRPHLLPIDVFRGARVAPRNGVTLRHALRWLERDGCLLVFPAGEVAHQATSDGRAVDSPWQTTAAELAARTGAAVVPVLIQGTNSRLFRAIGRVHPLLRTALLPREMWAMRGRTIPVRIGQPVPRDDIAGQPGGNARTHALRTRVEALAVTPVAPRGCAGEIAANVDGLRRHRLMESGAFEVFCARAPELPAILPEIGRLRELTFREAGEGTGTSRDLDRFDDTYQHLFVWDRARREIAGAYRIGATDVVARDGADGLYTRTLFEYDARLLDHIGPALELGRAFVQPAYQRDFSPLLLLWKGIARVAQCGHYSRLFGVVSISDQYSSTSRELLVKFLQTHRFDADLSRLVRAKNPPAPPRDASANAVTATSLEDVSSLVQRNEKDGKDIPVLLRQYLKLNAKLLGFTVDRHFGNVIDGLVIVDLLNVEPRILARFMPRSG